MTTAMREIDPRKASRRAAWNAAEAARMAGRSAQEQREAASEAAKRVWEQQTGLPVEDPLASGDVSREVVEEIRARRARKDRIARGEALCRKDAAGR